MKFRSAPHRKIAVADILKNPHRDLSLNPVSPERVEQLLESFKRNGFWENIVVREHPTREGKYELAYEHNRLAALMNNKVEVETITIPVAKLSDWDMYCAMVDENELQGAMTPTVAMENVNKGCDLVEKAFKTIGRNGTWSEYNAALGRVVSADTTPRRKHDGGFEQVRNAFLEGEGIGRRFIVDELPCGKMRGNAVSAILNSRYAEQRAEARAEKAKAKEKEAEEKRKRAEAEADEKKRRKLEVEAAKAESEAKKLKAAAAKIDGVATSVLVMFDAVRTMSDFAEAVRRLDIPREHHKAAAEYIKAQEVKEERIERELAIWWDKASGAEAKRLKAAAAKRDQDRLKKMIKSTDFTSFLLKIRDDLAAGDMAKRLTIAIDHAHLADNRGRSAIEKMRPISEKLAALIERSEEVMNDAKDITPASKLLAHQGQEIVIE
jgi:ParB-like nuclease family protein